MAQRLKNAWPILASAALYQLAFPPFNFGLLVFVALVPWLVSLAPREGRPVRGFRSGYLLGFLIVAGQMAFVQSLTVRWTGSFALSLLPWLVCCILGAFYFATLGAIFERAIAKGAWWVIPVCWAGMEVIRSFIPGLAFPFFLLATPLWPYPVLIQHAFIGTIYLVSGWVCIVNVLGAMFLLKTNGRIARPYAITALVLVLGSMLRFMQPLTGTPKRIVAGQPGVDIAYGDEQSQSARLFGNVAYLFSTAKRVKADLLVLPEGIGQGGATMPPRTPFSVVEGVPVLFGVRRYDLHGSIPDQRDTETKVYQSAYAYDGKWSYTDKARLVVFGEYVPGRNIIPFLDKFKLPSGDMTPGERTKALDVNGIRVGPMICFEGLFWDSAFKQVENGAQMLAIMSIDDWYMGTAAPDQLKTGAIWRAIECDIPVARAASTGYTMAVDQRGRVIREAPVGKPFALGVTLYLPERAPSMPLRQAFPWTFGLAVPVLGGWLLLRKRG